jgi:MoxR-like ATPase
MNIFGPHGVGKSKSLKKAAKRLGLKIKKLKIKKLKKKDLLGFPVMEVCAK